MLLFYYLRNACRKRVIKLSARFASPYLANQYYCEGNVCKNGEDSSSPSSMLVSPPPLPDHSVSSDPSVVFRGCKQALMVLQQAEQLELVCQLFSDIGEVHVPSDYLRLTCDAIRNLK